jgi:hypothetical protein
MLSMLHLSAADSARIDRDIARLRRRLIRWGWVRQWLARLTRQQRHPTRRDDKGSTQDGDNASYRREAADTSSKAIVATNAINTASTGPATRDNRFSSM